jgi:formylglycine-generating enzyme required for sulfatase activity
MAPEQAAGQQGEAKPAVDQYALGVVLYELLTGLTPFAGPPAVVLYNAVHTPPERPRQHRPEIPEELEAICLKAMAKAPGERFAHCQALADALGRWLGVNETAAHQENPFADIVPAEKKQATIEWPALKSGKEHRRFRWLMLAVAGATALALVILGIVVVIKYQSGDGKTRELSVEMSTTNEVSTKRSRGEGSRSAVTLPARYKDSLGIEFVLVPKGKFLMGSEGGNLDKTKEVEIPYDFYLGAYEVTQEEWQTVTGANPSCFSWEGSEKDKVKDIPDADLKRFPVENVSWNDVQLFLKVLNALKKEADWVYRLPIEAEWEYACRGGPRANKYDYAFDFYFDKPCNQLLPEQANFDNKWQRPCKVGSYKPNILGLHDVHGNVWEMCQGVERTPEGQPFQHDFFASSKRRAVERCLCFLS